MKKTITFIFTLAILSVKAFSQSGIADANLKDNYNLTDEFNKLYKDANEKGVFSICIVSATFAKFNIDTLGNVCNLVFYESEGTPTVFKKLLENVLKTSDGNWIPSTLNGKKVISRPIILPFTYQLQAGCKQTLRSMHTDDALGHFLDKVISDNKGPISCILMYPLNVSSVD
jgi:hypothetical protein